MYFPLRERTLSDIYQANCSSRQLVSKRIGQGGCVLGMLIDLSHLTTYVQCCVGMYIQFLHAGVSGCVGGKVRAGA